jgi:thioredoxin-disulfide reductase
MFGFNLEPQKVDAVDDAAVYDFLSLGGGPAGLNGALYARRKGLLAIVVANEIGGQIRNTSTVDNYLGFPEIDALDLVERYVGHVRALNIPILSGVRATSVKKDGDLFLVTLEDGRTLRTKTLLAALGGSPRRLGVPGELELAGKGVSSCATCDAPFFSGKRVIVAGGGNSAVEAAMDLAKWAKTVTIVHRSRFRADQVILDRMEANGTISVFLETQILAILGSDAVTGVRVLDKTSGTERTIPADGVFVEIGNLPNTGLFRGLVDVNERGEIVVDREQRTSTEGLFAAGDLTDQPNRQIIIAAAEGAKAALAASSYLNKKGS